MNFYQDYLKRLKKGSEVKSRTFGSLPKTVGTVDYGTRRSTTKATVENTEEDRKAHSRFATSPVLNSSGNSYSPAIANHSPSTSRELNSKYAVNNLTAVTNKTGTNSLREGARIKKSVKNLISAKYGELDSRHIFDGIDDDTVERNIPVAKAAIEDNIRRGTLTRSQAKKYPNLLDGMTMFYAAGDAGKSKAQNLARNMAYTEGKYPDITPTELRLYSNDIKSSDIAKLSLNKNTSGTSDVIVQNNNAGKRYVGADGVRIRNGYGLSATAMGLLYEGDEVEYTGRKTSKEIDGHYWAEIVHDDKKYWIAADYLTVEKNGGNGAEKSVSNYDTEFESNTIDDSVFNNSNTNPDIFPSKEYEAMYSGLTQIDKDAGITVTQVDDKYYYDYTTPIMNRINEVLPEFYKRDILTYEEYIDKYSIKLGGKYVVSTPAYDEYLSYVLGNFWFFFDQVNHEAPWDIKVDESWKQQFGDIKMPFYNGDDPRNEKVIFRGEPYSREDLGNLLYGYLGSAMGIGDITLYWGGGVAKQGIFSSKVRNPDKHYGDDEDDHDMIKKGIEMYYEDNPEAKPGINRTFP